MGLSFCDCVVHIFSINPFVVLNLSFGDPKLEGKRKHNLIVHTHLKVVFSDVSSFIFYVITLKLCRKFLNDLTTKLESSSLSFRKERNIKKI